MADAEGIKHRVMQAARPAVVSITEISKRSRRPIIGARQASTEKAMTARKGGASLRQCVFNWEAIDCYGYMSHTVQASTSTSSLVLIV